MNTAKKRSPVLVELILVILFFSLSTAVLVQVFVKAHQISKESQGQTLGLIAAEDLLEQWKEMPAEPERLFSEERGWKEEEAGKNVRTFRLGCKADMEPADMEPAVYEIRAELWEESKEAGELYCIRLLVTNIRDKKVLTELRTARYVAET